MTWRRLTVRWLAVVVLASAAAATAAAAAAAAAAEEGLTPCLGVTSCHCQQPGAVHCQLSDPAELRAVAARLPARPDLQLADLVARDLPSLPGRLFDGSTLHALLLSGSHAQHLPDDLLEGLNSSLRALGLGENRLVRVPTEALRPLTRLEQLDLSGNRLRTLSAGALPPLASLTELNLADNELSELSAGSLAALPSLQTLWLEGNRLNASRGSVGALAQVLSLKRLTLDHNQLSGTLTAQLTSSLPPSITELSLSNNNFTSVAAGALAPLGSLFSLDLSGNRIDVVAERAFSGLSRLRTLRLNGNQIVTLPAGGLSGLRSLTVLDLSRNALQAVTKDALTPLPALRHLLLRDNDLIQLDGSLLRALPALKRLDLAGNSLHCDCRLRQLAAYLADSRSSLDADQLSQATCATPLRLQNAPLLNLTADTLTCDEPEDTEQHQSTVPPSFDAPSDVISLRSAQLTADGGGVRLHWQVEPSLSPYRCQQVSLAARPDSQQPCGPADSADPTTLRVLLRVRGLAAGERHQFCLTLVQLTPGEEVRLPTVCRSAVLAPAPASLPQLDGLLVEEATADQVTVRLQLSEQRAADCAVTVLVLSRRGALSAMEASCTQRQVTLSAAIGAGPARVCSTAPYHSALPQNATRPLDAAVATAGDRPHRCVEVRPDDGAVWWQAGVAGLAALLAAGLLLGWALARWRRSACSVDSRRRGRTRLQSEDEDSTAGDDADGHESDADEETDLPV